MKQRFALNPPSLHNNFLRVALPVGQHKRKEIKPSRQPLQAKRPGRRQRPLHRPLQPALGVVQLEAGAGRGRAVPLRPELPAGRVGPGQQAAGRGSGQ
jgi:hypothetical protein